MGSKLSIVGYCSRLIGGNLGASRVYSRVDSQGWGSTEILVWVLLEGLTVEMGIREDESQFIWLTRCLLPVSVKSPHITSRQGSEIERNQELELSSGILGLQEGHSQNSCFGIATLADQFPSPVLILRDLSLGTTCQTLTYSIQTCHGDLQWIWTSHNKPAKWQLYKG